MKEFHAQIESKSLEEVREWAEKEERETQRKYVRVTFQDGNNIHTFITGTKREIEIYYRVGREFNIGSGPHDKMAKVAKLEFL